MIRELVIVTRVATSKDGVVPSEDWLAGRERLLRGVTAAALGQIDPSIMFHWCWRVHPAREAQAAEMRDRVWPQASIIGESDKTHDEIAPNAGSFLTVRLDSDDALHPRAIEYLRKMYVPENSVVNWPRGWQYDQVQDRVGPIERSLSTQGPFLGITHEDRSHMLDTGGHHGRARADRYVVTLHGYSWLQVVHGENLLNRWQASSELDKKAKRIVLKQFGVKL